MREKRHAWVIHPTTGAVLLLAVALALAPWATALAGQLSMEYSFERPQIKTVTINGDTYDRVEMSDAPPCGKVGQPALPARGAQILLPYGAEIESIEITAIDKVLIGKDFYIEPVAPQGKLTGEPVEIQFPTPDAVIYKSDHMFPESEFRSLGVQVFRGYRVLNLRLQPVQYLPTTGELYYSPSLRVTVKTVETGKASSLFRGLDVDRTEILQRVDNPEIANTYVGGKLGSRAYDLLIITTPDLATAFQPLKDYHDTTGILTEIRTTDQVGSTAPDDVRDYIRQAYIDDGIQYVIIGGDDDAIPAKDLYVCYSESGGTSESAMPGDLYFGCLDGTWNYDGDSQWGEPTDGEGGGDVDMVYDVYVGRAAADNTTEVDRFVNRTIQYLTADGQFIQTVLLVGEYLGFGGIAEYGGNYLDELEDGSSEHGYTTSGIPSSLFDIQRLYERDESWTMQNLIDRYNAGLHVVNHLGHGDTDYAMQLYNDNILSSITNTDHCFIYSQTCLAGHFDGTDCWAEHMNLKVDGGAFAVIMNARYGFGEFNSTDGASQRFNREFWDAIFGPMENKLEIGRANADSKEDNYYRISDDYMRWCYYEINLFGDPTVTFTSQGGIAFDFTNGVPEVLEPGVESTFVVKVMSAFGGTPAPGTGELHYSINDGTLQTVSMTELMPNQYEAALPALECGDWIDFYVSAEEAGGTRFYSPLPQMAYRAFPATEVVNVFEDDFEADRGWTAEATWERGTPTGGGGEYGNSDPDGAYEGTGVYGYNLSGDYENSMSEEHLTSSAIDCSGLFDVTLKFQRWLGVEQPSYDHAYIYISTDGVTWSTVWENGAEIADDEWVEMTYDISEWADNQPTVYIRFTMGETDSAWRYCGWNIDNLSVTGYICNENPDVDNDGVLDVDDNCVFVYNPYQEDANEDGIGDACCCVGTRGNVDGDPEDQVDIGDVTVLIDHLFISLAPVACPNEADIDGESGCDIGDLTRLIDNQYISLAPLPACP